MSFYIRNAILIATLFLCNVGYCQSLSGCVFDNEGNGIPSAVIFLHQNDSSIIEVITTDTLGNFSFINNPEEGFINIQHVSFESKIVAFKEANYSTLKKIYLSDKSNQLDDITVKAQAHLVKAEGNKLIVHPSNIKERNVITSAFDLIKYIPGVTVQGNSVKLLGTKEPTIIIDGKKTQQSISDIIEKLMSMSADKVSDIEIMYKAPAKFNVHGSLINIVTNKEQKESPITAEITSSFEQQYVGYYKGTQNIEYIGEKLRTDLMLGQRGGGIYTGSKEEIEYSYNENQTRLHLDNNNPEDYFAGIFKYGIDYDITDDIAFSSYYYAKKSIDKYEYNSTTNINIINQLDTSSATINSRNNMDDKKLNQNAYVALDLYDLSFSVDYINYEQNKTADYHDKEQSTTINQYKSLSTQLVDRWQILSDYSFNINDYWSMDVGINLTLSKSNTEIKYKQPEGNGDFYNDGNKYQLNIQKEHCTSIFSESSISILDSTMDISLEIEATKFVSKFEHNKEKKTLWDNFTIFPSLNIVWNFPHDNALDFTFYTHRDYPSYYSTNTDTTQINAIVSSVGNPTLLPDMQYYTDISYILNGLYTFSITGTYIKNYSLSLPYIEITNMQELEQEVNLDYDYEIGTMFCIPITYGIWNSNVTSYFFYHKQSLDNFHETSFNRNKYGSSFEMTNSFDFFDSKLTCNIDLFYKSKDIHGIYDMNHGFGLDLGLRWKILDNLILSSKWNNITGTYNPNPSTFDFNSIKSKYVDKAQECNTFDISLLYRIGNFKPKQLKGGDTNRIGM